MSQYIKNMGEYSPSVIPTTGVLMTENTIKFEDNSSLDITGDFLKDSVVDDNPPNYLISQAVEVRRYRLKK